ncbi:MFS transporter [Nocardia miyunensis]|uniref:MFS transporter n=1 Tax=Nocardia miyunensis TaxID=282684 RepID=UPI0008368383|nr:MFS transporter [Nocardia miyunensis]
MALNPPNRSTTALPTTPSRSGITIALACLGAFVSYLPLVGVSAALPILGAGLHASTSQLQWITDTFILPTAVLVLTFGTLGERYGRKRIYLTAMTLSCVGWVVCLTADSVPQLYVGLVLAGMGTAAMMPTTLALVSHAREDHRGRATAIALWTGSLGLGLTLGPVFSGLIAEHAQWRWIFLPELVLCALTLAAAAMALTEVRTERTRHLDVPGQLLAIIGLTGVVFGVIQGGAAGWGTPATIIAFVVAVLALPAFVVVELRSPNPMFDVRLFASAAFSGTALVMTITLFAQVGLVFTLSEYFGLVRHASTLYIGVLLIALNGFAVVLGPILGRMMYRLTPGLVLVAGLGIGGVAALCMSFIAPDTGTGTAVLFIALFGLGIALALAPITTIAVNSVPPRLAGTAGSANSALRQMGSALGPAVFGVVLTNRLLATLPGHLAGSALEPRDRGMVAGIVSKAGIQAGAFMHLDSGRGTALAHAAYALSFSDALHICALIAGIGMLLAGAIALVLIGVRRTRM